MPDERGKTRRERNTDFGVDEGPESVIPLEGMYLWRWYFGISDRLLRVQDGVSVPIPPTEFLAWCRASGTIFYDWEYAILCAMDDAYCEEVNEQLKDYRVRQMEERQAEAEKQRNSMPWRKGRR